LLEKSGLACSPGCLCQLLRKLVDDRAGPAHFSSIVKAVTPLLGHRSHQVRQAAVAILQDMPVLDSQLVLLTHKDCGTRMAAVRRLAELQMNPEQVQRVAGLTEHKSFSVRETAAMALASVTPCNGASALEALGKLLEDPVREVREAAASNFPKAASPDDPLAISVLMSRITHPEWPVQCVALRVLPEIITDSALVTSIAEEIRTCGATLAKITATKLLKKVAANSDACLGRGVAASFDEDEGTNGNLDKSFSKRSRTQQPQWHSEASDDEEDWFGAIYAVPTSESLGGQRSPDFVP